MTSANGASSSTLFDDGYNNFLKVINSSETDSSSTIRHRSKNGAAEAETGTLGAPPTPQDGSDSPLDEKEDRKPPAEEEILTIPESTHSFLFTEPVGSAPFMFSLAIALISAICLILALVYNIRNGEVPANIDKTVKIAQYMAILIVLLMEEEIPTGLYLLRRIPLPYLKKNFPQVKYSRFVASAVLRIVMGYTFLVNVMVVLIQADAVIDIFYDVLALQFIQQLDDIGFSLSKIDVLGKRLQRATKTPFFQFEFVKQKKKSSRFHKMGLFLKAIYFVNLIVFLTVMIVITVRQRTGYYQCEEITFKVGDIVWDDAFVVWPDGSNETMKLLYSYFNGVYAKDHNRLSNGRPIYVEQKKSDSLPFDDNVPYTSEPELQTNYTVKPAEIRYCDGRWMFTHEYIHKRKNTKEEDCRWLIRSPEDDGFNLLEVSGDWDLWAGVITNIEVSNKCNKCSSDSDCNLNGECNIRGECACNDDEDVLFLGTHCEFKLKDKCRTIISEVDNGAWSIGASDWMISNDDIFKLYSRPVYSYERGTSTSNGTTPFFPEPSKSDSFALIYSGLRWFAIYLPLSNDLSTTFDFWAWQSSNYHAFWSKAYSDYTYFVSDPTTSDSPVGVDFYKIREHGTEQFGQLGFLVPMQPTGRGLFRCEGDGTICSFCADGLSAPYDKVIDPVHGATCGWVHDKYALGLKEGGDECNRVQLAEPLCCPKKSNIEADSCSFCPDGITVKEDFIVPDSGGQTCGNLLAYTLQLKQNDDHCTLILPAEECCCPRGEGNALEPTMAESGEESDTSEEPNMCVFCPNGITTEENYIIPESNGQTCSGLKGFASSLKQSDILCDQIQLAERLCCYSP